MELKTAYPIKTSSSLSYEENKLPIINMQKEGRYTIVTHKQKLRLDERIGAIFIVCLCTLLTLGISCAFKWQAILWEEGQHGYRYPRVRLSNQLFIQQDIKNVAKEFHSLQHIFLSIETLLPQLKLDDDHVPLFHAVHDQLKSAERILDEIQKKLSDHPRKVLFSAKYFELRDRFQQLLDPAQTQFQQLLDPSHPLWTDQDIEDPAQQQFVHDIAQLEKLLYLDNKEILENQDKFFQLITKIYININEEKTKYGQGPFPDWIAKAEKQKSEIGNAFILRLELFAPMNDKAIREKILGTFTCPISMDAIETIGPGTGPVYLEHQDRSLSSHAFEKASVYQRDPVTNELSFQGMPIIDGQYTDPLDRKPVARIMDADPCFAKILQNLKPLFADD